jgi:5-methylcytosine-specific restriction protein B
MAADASADALRVLLALRTDKCVLIKGVPASGKSRLLGEVRRLFAEVSSDALSTPDKPVAIAEGSSVPNEMMPSPNRTDRKVWEAVMNQNTRYKDFWRGTDPHHDGSEGYTLSEGVLYRANEHAKTDDGAALVTVDELNRGPAVNVFGPSIVAIEADKRASEDNAPIEGQTAGFELKTVAGSFESYWLSPHLYIVCAQNNADTSVEAIDTAFLRRFVPIELGPDESVLTEHFGLADLDGELPDAPASADDVYRAAVRAWRNVNRKLAIGASPDFRIGHGALMNPNQDTPHDNPQNALDYVRRGWARVDQHISEVFYGKPDHIAEAYWVDEGGASHPYKLTAVAFGDLDQVVLERDDSDLYKVLRAVAAPG